MYYGAGLVSAIDKYPEIEKNIPVQTKKVIPKVSQRSPLYHPEILDDIPVSKLNHYLRFISFIGIRIIVGLNAFIIP